MNRALFLLLSLICTNASSAQETRPLQLLESPDFSQETLDTLDSEEPFVTHQSNHPHIQELNQKVLVGRPGARQVIDIEIPNEATPAPLLLRVDGPVQGLQIKAESGEPRGDIQELALWLTQDLEHDYDKALMLFRYAYQNFKNWLPAGDRLSTHGISPHNLADNFWVYGYGYCEDISYFLAALWQAAGLQARVVGIGHRHAQAEVFYDQNWHLFDAQHRTYWRDQTDNILSASQLKTNPKYFYRNLDAFGLDPIAYPPVLLEKWYTENDLTYTATTHRDWQTDLSLNLRPGEFFELRYVGRPTHYRNPLWVQMLGEFPRERRPPFGIAANLYYDPKREGLHPEFQTIELSDQRTAHVFPMQSPYIFTDGWVHLPHLANKAEVFIWADDQFTSVGRPKLQGLDISSAIVGLKRIAICVVLDQPEDLENLHQGFKVHTQLQVANVGLPRLKAGLNQWPFSWQAGNPRFWLWYREHAADLSVSHLRQEPEHPKVGEMTKIIYQISNNGSAQSLPTQAVLTNPTTGLLMETVETVGHYTIPPIQPGESVTLETWWQANTRMHWYGQNPYVQTLDLRIDPDRLKSDADRTNHRIQHHIHLRRRSGKAVPLPGYTKIGL